MTAEDQGWEIDDGPDLTDCDLGQHDWALDHADYCNRCGASDCLVTCRHGCGAESRDCELNADRPVNSADERIANQGPDTITAPEKPRNGGARRLARRLRCTAEHALLAAAAAAGRCTRALRATAGRALRTAANRIDPAHEPRGFLSFTIERGEGLRIRWDRRGCPLWYFGADDYARAFSEANSKADSA